MTTEDRISALETEVALLKAAFVGMGKTGPAPKAATAEGEVATDADLDSQYGNQPVRKDPNEKNWKGKSCIGLRLSECPADYLDAFAKYKDSCAYMNEKSGDPAKAKYIAYDRRDAARARGWAKRIRDGYKPPAGTDKPIDDKAYPSGWDDPEPDPFQ